MQKGEALAAGLTSVFAHFAEDHQLRTIAFNSDSPHLPRSALENAFETLTKHEIVVGPTHDGGYYLVGAKAFHHTLFRRRRMGRVARWRHCYCAHEPLSFGMLRSSFYDIDVDDLSRLEAELRLAPSKGATHGAVA